jgi:hypothetical protein
MREDVSPARHSVHLCVMCEEEREFARVCASLREEDALMRSLMFFL